MEDNQKLEQFNKKYPIKQLNVDGKIWRYVVKGTGKDGFLIFPGGGQNAQSVYSLIDSFSTSYKVISVSIHDVSSIEEFNNAINTILKEEKVEKVVVYGLSLGALLAQSYTKRNFNKVIKLIISHGSSPNSATYRNKIIRPLQALNLVLPIIPSKAITLLAKLASMKVQGAPKDHKRPFNHDPELLKLLGKRYYESYLNKKLLRTWISLHFDFYRNEHFNQQDFKRWSSRVLILRTDNDPLMQDDGEFKKLYSDAIVHTFHGTGHLSFYFKQDEITQLIAEFIKEK